MKINKNYRRPNSKDKNFEVKQGEERKKNGIVYFIHLLFH